MQFINRDPLFRIIRVTGPHHNLLGLQLSPEPTEGEAELEALDRSSGLNGREVATQVLLGVHDACSELHARYYVAKIQYVAADTPPVEVYRWLAKQLVRWIDESRRNDRRESKSDGQD